MGGSVTLVWPRGGLGHLKGQTLRCYIYIFGLIGVAEPPHSPWANPKALEGYPHFGILGWRNHSWIGHGWLPSFFFFFFLMKYRDTCLFFKATDVYFRQFMDGR